MTSQISLVSQAFDSECISKSPNGTAGTADGTSHKALKNGTQTCGPLQANANNDCPKRTIKDTIKYLKEVVTVEPIVAFYQMGSILARPTLENLEFEKSCRVNLKYNDSICDAILSGNHSNYKIQNVHVQQLISIMHSWQQPAFSFMPLVLILFLGSYSDRHKWRKPFLMMPLIGELLGNLGCIVSASLMYQLPLEAQGVMHRIVPSLFGGQLMLIMASTAYIADVSSVKMRTLRLGMVQIVISVVSPTMQSISGIYFVNAGYLPVLSTSATLNTLGLLYGAFCIKDQAKERREKSKVCVLKEVFDPKHATETFKVAFKKSQESSRAYIWLLLVTIFIYRAAYDAEGSLYYLYLQNVFSWTPLEYSYYLTINSLVYLIGHVCAVPFFTKVLHWSDLTIMLVTILDKIISNIIIGSARTVAQLYAGVAANIIVRVYAIAKKSLATKIVSKHDIGKTQSLIGILEGLAPAVSVPIYNQLIYLNTLQTFPQAIYFFSILLFSICCILIMFMYQQEYKIKKSRQPEDAKQQYTEKEKKNSNVIETQYI